MIRLLKKLLRSFSSNPADPSSSPNYKENSNSARAVRLSLTYKNKTRGTTSISDTELLFRAVAQDDKIVRGHVHQESWDPRQRLGVSVNRSNHSIPSDLTHTLGQTFAVAGYAEGVVKIIHRSDEVQLPLVTGSAKKDKRSEKYSDERSRAHPFFAGRHTILFRVIHTPQPDELTQNTVIENYAHSSISICINENMPLENPWELDDLKDIEYGLLSALEDYFDILRKHLSRCFPVKELFL